VRYRISILGALVAALLCGGAVWGADKKTEDKKPARTGRLPRYYKNLDLTDAQKQKVYDIQARYKDRISELNRQLKELRAKQNGETEGVLNQQQKAKLMAMRKRVKSGSSKTTDEPKKTTGSKRKSSRRKAKPKKDEKPANDK
jgi:hypothetical protein